MDSRTAPSEFMTAGANYLGAVKKLGLDPVYLGWGWEKDAAQWILVLVTSIVDAGGPLALNELLIRAYNADATPREISPFIVRVFSPEMLPLEQFAHLSAPRLMVSSSGKPDIEIANMHFEMFGIDFERANSYKATGRPIKKYGDQRDAWQRFKRQVDRVAA